MVAATRYPSINSQAMATRLISPIISSHIMATSLSSPTAATPIHNVLSEDQPIISSRIPSMATIISSRSSIPMAINSATLPLIISSMVPVGELTATHTATTSSTKLRRLPMASTHMVALTMRLRIPTMGIRSLILGMATTTQVATPSPPTNTDLILEMILPWGRTLTASVQLVPPAMAVADMEKPTTPRNGEADSVGEQAACGINRSG